MEEEAGSKSTRETLWPWEQLPTKCVCFSPSLALFLWRGGSRRVDVLARKSGANPGLGPVPTFPTTDFVYTGQGSVLFLFATFASGKGYQTKWPHRLPWLSLLLSPCALITNYTSLALTVISSHIWDNACHYCKCSNFFQFCYILSYFFYDFWTFTFN